MPTFLKESMKQIWNLQRGGELQTKNPSVGGVWMISGTTQWLYDLCHCHLLTIMDTCSTIHLKPRNCFIFIFTQINLDMQ